MLQLENAKSPIFETFFRSIFLSPRQFRNAFFGMEESVDGIVTELTPVSSEKQPSQRPVTPSAMTIFVMVVRYRFSPVNASFAFHGDFDTVPLPDIVSVKPSALLPETVYCTPFPQEPRIFCSVHEKCNTKKTVRAITVNNDSIFPSPYFIVPHS